MGNVAAVVCLLTVYSSSILQAIVKCAKVRINGAASKSGAPCFSEKSYEYINSSSGSKSFCFTDLKGISLTHTIHGTGVSTYI